MHHGRSVSFQKAGRLGKPRCGCGCVNGATGLDDGTFCWALTRNGQQGEEFCMAKASRLDFASCSTMQDRVKIDTSPFQSVKAAVTMFGAKIDGEKSRMVEKHVAKEAEVKKLKEELSILRRQLADAEEGKAKALAELEDAKTRSEKGSGDPWIADQCATSGEQQGQKTDESKSNSVRSERITGFDTIMIGSEQNPRIIDASHPSNLNTEEKHVAWEVQLRAAQKQHMHAIAELESAKKELEKLKKELMVSLREKESAIRQAEEALMAAELNARRVEELSHEISGTNESLVLVKLACIGASKEPSSHHQSTAEHNMGTIQELEIRLTVTAKELIRLREELALAKEAEVKVSMAASEGYANLTHTQSELEKARLQTSSTGAPTSFSSSELKATKGELEKALENGLLLQSTMDTLQLELVGMRHELVDLTSREATVSAAVATLTSELSKTKADLGSAIAAEKKANQALLSLTQTLQQIQVKAEEAKLSSNVSKEKARKAREDADRAKDALVSAQQEVEATIKAAEAAQAAESEALEKFKALAESTSAAQVAGRGQEEISVSQEEDEKVKEKPNDTERLADTRVAAADTKEVVKMGELELEQKLRALNQRRAMMKGSTEQALLRAQIAESAKLAVESQIRRWRERRHPTKKVEFSGHVSSSVQPAESLAQVLKKEMPPFEHNARPLSDRASSHRKKQLYLPALNYFK